MGDSLIRLPATVLLANVAALWADWQRSLKAEAAGVTAQAGRELQVNAAELSQFDTSVLSLLLSASRLCTEHGLTLRVQGAPDKLRQLAKLYGIDELLWPSELAAA
jgi:phospholipid transport system transporter-binding protein